MNTQQHWLIDLYQQGTNLGALALFAWHGYRYATQPEAQNVIISIYTFFPVIGALAMARITWSLPELSLLRMLNLAGLYTLSWLQ